MQRLAKPGAGIDHHWNLDRCGGIGRKGNLFGHRQQRLGDRARSAANVSAAIYRFEPGLLDQTRAERVVDGRHMQERFCA